MAKICSICKNETEKLVRCRTCKRKICKNCLKPAGFCMECG